MMHGAHRYEPRTYRERVSSSGLVSFEVNIAETNLLIRADKDLQRQAISSVRRHRAGLERYIERHPDFIAALEPVEAAADAPEIVQRMCGAGAAAGVGPMAAVAGAIAEFVGRDLLRESAEVIVENGGDIFLATGRERVVAIYAGASQFSEKVGLRVPPELSPLGICTSSGTVGHSKSFGRADAAVVAACDAALADAVATAMGNRVKRQSDLEAGLELARSVAGVIAAVVVLGDKLGAWGELELVRIG